MKELILSKFRFVLRSFGHGMKVVLLSSRVKSLSWQCGAFLLVGVVQEVGQNLELFNLPTSVAFFVSLILGQITKGLNNYLQGKPTGWIRE